nr:TasA family protein [uncultured Caproiciproducens sp.]
MKKKIALIATSAIVAAALVVGGTLAYFTDKGTASNVVTMGNVRISLEEPGFGEWTDNTFTLTNVMPKDVIDKDPTITNTGDHDAYIRCKITVKDLPQYTGENSTTSEQDLLAGLNIDKDWVLNPTDHYYYYQKVLKNQSDADHSVQFFTKFTVPEKWDNSFADKTFTIGIVAEAIQADNFTPHSTNNGTKDVIDGWKYLDSGEVAVQSATPLS